MAALFAAPFLVTEVTTLATEASVGFIAGAGQLINSVLAFTGASVLISEAVDMIKPKEVPLKELPNKELPNPLNLARQNPQQISTLESGKINISGALTRL